MISVIVPVYNVSEYLDTCITSIIYQSYKNLEIIVVDDGSTDGSEKMCDQWADKDTRIKVIHKKNGGLSDARNYGIEVATGEYISFIDSDDFIAPTYFEYLYNNIIDNDADLSVCQLYIVNEYGKPVGVKGKYKDKFIQGNENCMAAFLQNTAIDTTAWRKLYKNKLFKDSGIRYPVGRYHEDVFTTYKIISLCQKIFVGSECLYAYRKRSGSIVNSSFSPKHLDAIYGNVERFNFISKHFPKLEREATKGIIYAANQCIIRLAKSKTVPDEHIKFLSSIYKKFLPLYLKSSATIRPKIFASCARINTKLMTTIISIIFKPNEHN